MNKSTKKIGLLLAMIVTVGGITTPVSARGIGEFQNFKVTYSGAEKYTGEVNKSVTGRKGAVNLSQDTGTAWITVNMRNRDLAFRGGTTVQRGKRATFATPNAQGGFWYKLGMKKTNNTGGGSVTIKGNWSPDEY